MKGYYLTILIPICGKIFESVLYNSMFDFPNQNDLISPAQSGFKSGSSCINQLLSVTSETYHSMDEVYETRGVFLDILKSFDKVLLEGLVFKLKKNGVSGNLLSILEDFLATKNKALFLMTRHLIGKIFLQMFRRFYLGTTFSLNLYQWFSK